MNFLKGVLSHLKNLQLVVAILVLFAVIFPLLLKFARKVPVVGPVVDKLPVWLAALLLAMSAAPTWAADQIIHKGAWANSLILKAPADNRPMLRIYDSTQTNFLEFRTNGAIRQSTASSNYDSVTVSVVVSNAIGGPRTLYFRNGILTSTNY